MAIPWLNSMSLGIPVLDLEHRHLLDLLNSAQDSLADGDYAAAQAGICDYLANLSDHFQREERLMRRFRYQHFEAHRRNHDAVRDKAREIAEALAGRMAPREFAAVIFELQNSLIRRMLLDDSGLATHLDHLGLRTEDLEAD